MKKILFIVLFTIFSGISNNTKAQLFLGEAFVGLNICQVDGDQMMGFFKKGINVGVGVITPVYQKRNFSMELSLEVLFNQKGALQGRKYHDGATVIWFGEETEVTGEYNMSLNYGEVPLILYLTDKKFASVGVGVSYARLMSIKEYAHGKESPITLYSGEYTRDEFNIIADVKIRVWKRLKLGARYSYSINPIGTRSWPNIEGEILGPFDQRNNLFTFRLTYVFNENLDELKREEYHYQGDNPRYINKANERALKKAQKKEAREERKASKKQANRP